MSDPLKEKISQFLPASTKLLTSFELVKSGSIALFAFCTAAITRSDHFYVDHHVRSNL